MADPSTVPDFDDEEALDTIGIGEFTWPLPPPPGGPSRCGSVLIEDFVAPELKVDAQKASGTDKAKTKVSGVDVGEGKFELWWTRHVNAAAWAIVKKYLPGGELKGKPQEIRHPYFDVVDIHSVIITKISWKKKGDAWQSTWEWKEWNEPPAAVAGATTTPTDPSQWTAKQNPAMNPANTTAKGFNGPTAPATSPK